MENLPSFSSNPCCYSHEKIEHIFLQQTEEKLLMKTDFFMITLPGSLPTTITLSFGTDAYLKWSFFLLFLVPHLVKVVECNGPYKTG